MILMKIMLKEISEIKNKSKQSSLLCNQTNNDTYKNYVK